MNVPAGTRLGPYEVAGFIGAGAMGVVYKARDTRLGRDIAIKVLPPVFAKDADRLARFEHEARAVAAINHPNIVSVYDIGSADAPRDVGNDGDDAAHSERVRVAYLVTELLDGDTLRAQLAGGPLGARRSIDVAIQVARGLAAAHDRGIVHRDLKPENIVLLRGGHVKILDFGLAKQPDSMTAAGGPHHHTAADQQMTRLATDAGTVLGTVGYMAPEQVRAEPVDARSDLFALGAVLHELVTGKRAFERPTAAETMTAILREEPADLESMPPGLAAVVRHALEKDAHDRFQSARDFAFALQALSTQTGSGAESSLAAPTLGRRRHWRNIAPWGIAAVLALALASTPWWARGAATSASRTSVSGSPIVFSPAIPLRDTTLSSPAISPDDTRVAFITHSRAGDSIVVRRLTDLDAQPIKGTTGVRAGGIFWSPDGQALGFFASGKLKVVDLASGKIDEIADAPSAYGGAWGRDGTILFSPDERTALYRVSAKGGAVSAVTTLDAKRGDEAHRWPQFLPDGRHFVFAPWKLGSVTRSLQLASLDSAPSTTSQTLCDSESAAIVAWPYLLYARERPATWFAQAFNPQTLTLEGRPVPVVADDNVSYVWATGDGMASATPNTLIYTTGKLLLSRLTWFSRVGQPLGTVGDTDVYYDPTLAPDGSRLVVEKRDPDRGTTDLWTVDLGRGVFSRLTDAPGFESTAVWSPDGNRIAYASDQGPSPAVLIRNANGTGAEERLFEGRAFPMSWSPDGRYLLYMTDRGATRMDILVYDTERRASTPLLASAATEEGAVFSPNGKWIAYASDESRQMEVYVRSFPDSSTKIRVSTAGGVHPQWRGDGSELFYLSADGMLTAAEIRVAGNSVSAGTVRPLFPIPNPPADVLRTEYAPSADGQKFLVKSLASSGSSPLVGVLNWQAPLAAHR